MKSVYFTRVSVSVCVCVYDCYSIVDPNYSTECQINISFNLKTLLQLIKYIEMIENAKRAKRKKREKKSK